VNVINSTKIYALKWLIWGQVWGFIPIISTAQDVDIRRIVVQGQPRQKESEIPPQAVR
jgi:hypothetical protein